MRNFVSHPFLDAVHHDEYSPGGGAPWLPLQRVEIFSTESTIVSDPNPDFMLLPLFLDPASHLKYRQLYNARFSPGTVERLTPTARQAPDRTSPGASC